MKNNAHGNPFTTLGDLLEDLFTVHTDNARLDRIIDQNAAILHDQIEEKNSRETIISQQAIMQADLLSIKAFLGVPDSLIVATQEQIDALGSKLQSDTAKVEQFDSTIPSAAS